MKNVVPAFALFLCACATTDPSERLARNLAESLDVYEAQLAAKVAEQNRFYAARAEEHARSVTDLLAAQREQLRARAAVETASRMSGSPDTEARHGNIVRFLLQTAQEEAALDRALRDEAASSEASFRQAMRRLDLQRAELKRVRDALRTLSARRDPRALAGYLEQLEKELDRADQP